MISSIESSTSQPVVVVKGESDNISLAESTGIKETVMKESAANEGNLSSTEHCEIVNRKKHSEQCKIMSKKDEDLSSTPIDNSNVFNEKATKLADVRESSIATINGYLDKISSNFDDIFRTHQQSVLGSNSLTKTTKLDRLLATESRMSSLKKHLSFPVSSSSTMSNRKASQAEMKSMSSASDINALKSPTFSMADITVVVPQTVKAAESEEKGDLQKYDDSFPSANGLNDLMSENFKTGKKRCFSAKQRNTSEENSVKENEDRKRNRGKLRRKKQKSRSNNTESKITSTRKNEKMISSSNVPAQLPTCESNATCVDSDIYLQQKNSCGQALSVSDHIDDTNSPQSLTVVEDLADKKKSSSITSNKGDMLDKKSIDLKDNPFIDSEEENMTEWKYVENSRSKQKQRRLNQTAKSMTSLHTNSSVNRSGNPNLISPSKSVTMEKVYLRPKNINQSNRSASLNHRHLTTNSHLNRTTIDVTEKRTSTHTEQSSDDSPLQLANVKQVLDGSNHKVKTASHTKLKDNANSLNLEVDQTCTPTSSSIVDCHSMQNNTDSVSNCEKMSVGEANSTAAAGLNSHHVEETATPVNKLESVEQEESVQSQVNEVKENSASSDDNLPQVTTPKLSPEELQRQLKNQLEYYFSRENLAQDPYLVSQMNEEQYVSIYTIANFNAIKKLTADISQVIEALKVSRLVEVDEKEEMVRPNPNRCAVMLREIPESVKQEEVTALFTDCPAKYTSCEYAGNTNWYVYFDSENDAQSALRYLRESVKEFQGKPIMARFKSKTHHLNTYSYQTLTSNMQEAKEQAPNSHEAPPQVSQPMDFIPPLVSFPPGPFPSHPNNQVAAIPTSLLARVAAPSPAVPVPSSGQGPTAAMAVNPHFNSIVVSPWPPGFYPPDAPVMASHLPPQFFPPAFKAAQMPHYTQSPVAGGKSVNNSSGHRFTDFHKGVASQRNSYSQQRKSSNSNYSQQHNNNAPSKSRYVLTTDPNPPNLMPEVIGHYVQSEQGATHVPHTMATPHPTGHYLPAVTAPFAARAPFVTPSANDPNIVLVPQAHIMPPPPNVNSRPGSRRGHGQSSYHGYRSSNSYPHNDHVYSAVGSANGQRSRHSHSSRANNYHQEISPRFIQKGGANYGYHHSPAYGVMSSGHSSDSNDMKQSYSNRTNNGSAQRQRNSPNADVHSTESSNHHSTADTKEHYSEALNSDENNNKRTLQASSNGGTEQKTPHQGGLEQRRNSKPRRPRRNEDERSSSIPAPPPPPHTFNLESNSFPPLPGATEGDAAIQTSQDSDSRAPSDTVKEAEVVKPSSAEIPIAASVPPKKYSEVSSASLVTRNQLVHSKPATEETKTMKKSEVKVASAVNTQPVADKHPPVVNKRPVHSKPVPADRKQISDASKSSNRPRASSSSTGHPAPNPGRKPARNPSNQTEPTKNAPAPKTDSTKSDAKKEIPSRHSTDLNEAKSVVKDDLSLDEKELSGDGNDRRPTYAEVMKARKAKQANGKAMSDSGKSDSGDDNRSVEEGRDADAKSVETEKGSKPPHGKADKEGETNRPDRKGGAMNGPWRRNDFDHRGWHGNRHYRERNGDFRGNRGRDRHFNSDRGNFEYRGRGGFRGRRGGFRGYYNNNNGGGRSAPNSQNSNDR